MSDCTCGHGFAGHDAACDAYLSIIKEREELVQDVIKYAAEFGKLSEVGADLEFEEQTRRMVLRVEARSALLEAAVRLAEWRGR